jgi:hypothetical protein
VSLRLLLVLLLFAVDAWALERLWRPGMPRPGRLRWMAAIIGVPVFGAYWSWKNVRPLPAASVEAAPTTRPAEDPDTPT